MALVLIGQDQLINCFGFRRRIGAGAGAECPKAALIDRKAHGQLALPKVAVHEMLIERLGQVIGLESF